MLHTEMQRIPLPYSLEIFSLDNLSSGVSGYRRCVVIAVISNDKKTILGGQLGTNI
jgi:hypothetical protein